MFDRSHAPIESKTIPFQLPKIENFILENGIEVYFVKKNNLPIVYLTAFTSAGSRFDNIDKLGTAYLTSLLIDEGAGEFNALQLNDEFEKLGTNFSVSVNPDTIGFSMLSLSENFSNSLNLFCKVLTSPRFEQPDFEREKKKVLDRILQLKDEAGYIASSVFERLIFKNSFYEFPEIGYSETVGNISNDDIKNFYQNRFGTNHVKFFIVGNLETQNVAELLNKQFGFWKTQTNSSTNFAKLSRQTTKYFVVDKKDSAQSEIRVGHISKRRNTEDFYAAKIMNTILGGQFSSRINLNLRENKGFTYGAGSNFSYYQNAGLFEVHTAVNIHNTGAAVKEIFNELTEIKNGITEKEIEFAKSTLIKQYPSRFETFSQIAKNIESLVVHSIPLDELKVYEDKLFSVTNEEINKAAVDNIFPEESFVVICGEKESVNQQLKDDLGVDAVELTNEGNKL